MANGESASVAEIVTFSLAAARVPEQNGIDHRPQGGWSLAHVCRERKLDASAVSAAIQRADADAQPGNWTSAALSSLIAHILSNHHEELTEAAAARGIPLPHTPFGSVAHPIRMMEIEHEPAGGALVSMRELTSGYSVPAYACVTYPALMNVLRDLNVDRQQHIHLENGILFPREMAIECECGRSAEAVL